MKNKGYMKIIIPIIILYVIVGIFIPIIFKYSIFENDSLSKLSNNEWAGFLGSYVGGILGGLGTLISVYLTVKSSFSIQEQNKKETDERIEAENKRHQAEIDKENCRREDERKSDQEEANKRDRQQFVNSIAKELGIYITHISKYYYAFMESKLLREKVNREKNKLSEIEQQLKQIDDTLSTVDQNDWNEIYRLYFVRFKIVDDKDRSSRIYNEALEEQRANAESVSRIAANEAFFTLKAMLGNNRFSSNLLSTLEEVHKKATNTQQEDEFYSNWLDNEGKRLIKEFNDFMGKYIENAE